MQSASGFAWNGGRFASVARSLRSSPATRPVALGLVPADLLKVAVVIDDFARLAELPALLGLSVDLAPSLQALRKLDKPRDGSKTHVSLLFVRPHDAGAHTRVRVYKLRFMAPAGC